MTTLVSRPPNTFGNLLRAEILRVRSRRMARWLAITMLGVLGITILIVLVNPPTSHEMRYDPASGMGVYSEGPFILTTGRLRGFIYGFVPSLLGVSVLVGSSLVGAEWATRGLTNLLVWETRRERVMAAKLAAAGIVIGAAVLAFIGLLVALLFVAALLRGEIGNVDLANVALMSVRASIFAILVAALGATTAAVMRSTVAAFAIAFVLLAVVQPILQGWSEELARWLFTTNAIAFLTWDAATFGNFTQSSPWQAGAVLVGYAAVFVAISTAVFRRQEIG